MMRGFDVLTPHPAASASAGPSWGSTYWPPEGDEACWEEGSPPRGPLPAQGVCRGIPLTAGDPPPRRWGVVAKRAGEPTMPERVYVVYVWCHGMRWGRTPWRPPPKRWPTFRQWLTAEAVANTTSVAVRRRPEAPEVVIGSWKRFRAIGN